MPELIEIILTPKDMEHLLHGTVIEINRDIPVGPDMSVPALIVLRHSEPEVFIPSPS